MGLATRTSDRFLLSSSLAIRYQFAVQLLIGLSLSFAYSPSATMAHASVATMHSGGIERVLQGMHYWGSAVLILHGFVHLAAAIWMGGYQSPFGLRFVETTIEFAIAVAFQMTGNLLPFDRHGVQTAGIEASIAARAPGIGPWFSHLLLGSDTLNVGTLVIWYRLHSLILPLVLAVAVIASLVAHRKPNRRPDGSGPEASHHETESEAKPRPSLGSLVPAFLWFPFVLGLGLFLPSPLGSGATPADFGAFDSHVSWYVWPLHGTMRMFDALFSGGGWIGAILAPGIFLLFVLSLPLIAGRLPLSWVRGISAAFLALFAGGAVVYGGQFAPLTGTRDPATVSASTVLGSAIDPALAARGRTAFNQLSCAGCHGVDGARSAGGPVLTQIWRRHADAGYYEKFIASPTSVKPNSTMPAFPNLTPGQLSELAEFLRMPK